MRHQDIIGFHKYFIIIVNIIINPRYSVWKCYWNYLSFFIRKVLKCLARGFDLVGKGHAEIGIYQFESATKACFV